MPMEEPHATHPYRPDAEQPVTAPASPRQIPPSVRWRVLFGGFRTVGLLLLFDFGSAMLWLNGNGGASLMVVAIALAALVLFEARHVSRMSDALELLRKGRVSYAKLIGKQKLPLGVNDEVQRYSLRFAFEERGERHTFETITTDPGPLTDDAREQIIYPPGRPSEALLVDSLPARPRVLEDGTIADNGYPGSLVAVVLMAALGVGINVLGICIVFAR